MAVPVGILAGVYLAENQARKSSDYIRTTAEVLQGVPSIVLGIIAYLWLVKPLGGFSALSGSVALAFMMLPMIVRSTEEALKLVPNSLKEASLALGVPYYRTMLRVVIPAAFSGIITGIMLGVSRIAGETAPLLFTAFGNAFLTLNPLKPVNSLPLLIFNYAASPYASWHELAWGAALVLLVGVLSLNILAKRLARKWKTQF
jgi:phosphate transport system permease protein